MTNSPIDERRESLIDACERLMMQVGFQKMSMEEVAREAGVSRRTVYCYFRTKVDLGLSCIDRVVQQAQAAMLEAADDPVSYPDRLRRMLSQRVLIRLENVRLYSASLDEMFEVVRPAYLENRKADFEREAKIVMSLLQAGIHEKQFRNCNAKSVAESMIYATNAFIPYSLSSEEIGSKRTVTNRLQAMVDLLLVSVALIEKEPTTLRGRLAKTVSA